MGFGDFLDDYVVKPVQGTGRFARVLFGGATGNEKPIPRDAMGKIDHEALQRERSIANYVVGAGNVVDAIGTGVTKVAVGTGKAASATAGFVTGGPAGAAAAVTGFDTYVAGSERYWGFHNEFANGVALDAGRVAAAAATGDWNQASTILKTINPERMVDFLTDLVGARGAGKGLNASIKISALVKKLTLDAVKGVAKDEVEKAVIEALADKLKKLLEKGDITEDQLNELISELDTETGRQALIKQINDNQAAKDPKNVEQGLRGYEIALTARARVEARLQGNPALNDDQAAKAIASDLTFASNTARNNLRTGTRPDAVLKVLADKAKDINKQTEAMGELAAPIENLRKALIARAKAEARLQGNPAMTDEQAAKATASELIFARNTAINNIKTGIRPNAVLKVLADKTEGINKQTEAMGELATPVENLRKALIARAKAEARLQGNPAMTDEQAAKATASELIFARNTAINELKVGKKPEAVLKGLAERTKRANDATAKLTMNFPGLDGETTRVAMNAGGVVENALQEMTDRLNQSRVAQPGEQAPAQVLTGNTIT